MATVNNDAKRIKLSLDNLNTYDKNIKSWAIDKIAQEKEIVFAARANFPSPGKDNILYVDGDNIYRWDESTSDYILINSTSSGAAPFEWETF